MKLHLKPHPRDRGQVYYLLTPESPEEEERIHRLSGSNLSVVKRGDALLVEINRGND